MATTLQNLDTAIANVSAQLAALADLSPNYSVDGESVSSKLAHLTDQLGKLQELRSKCDTTWTEIEAMDT